MGTTRWEPFREVEDFFRHHSPALAGLVHHDDAAACWCPVAYIHETAQEYVVTAELPDVRKEDMQVTFADGVLTVSGERREEITERSGRGLLLERSFGSFSRSFCLPENVDAGSIRAETLEGVLLVHLPKGTGAPSKGVLVPIS